MSAIPYLGEILALLAAIVWSIAVILFKKSGEVVHPLGLNLFKTILTGLLFIPTIYLFGEKLFRPAPFFDYALLFCSGVLGIGIGDTLFFKSLNLLGAGMTAIVDCLYSPFIIGLSILWLGERMTFVQVIGTLMILSAVLTSTTENKEKSSSAKPGMAIDRRAFLWGILWGALAILSMALGVVMVKPLLGRSPLLWVTEVRLLGGISSLVIILVFHPRWRSILKSISTVDRWGYTLSGSFIGTYVAMLLWLGGMKFTQASTAAVLNQTSNIFIFIFAAIFLREPLDRQRTIGIMLGVVGAFLVSFG